MARRKRVDDRPIPEHPYRDSALVYGVLSALLVALAWLTGGNPVRAILVAIAFFVFATAWSCWKFRGRIKRRDAVAAAVTPAEREELHPTDDGGGSTT